MFNDEDSHKFKSRVDLSKSRQVNAEDAIRYGIQINSLDSINYLFLFRNNKIIRFDKYVGKQADELI